MRLPYSLWLGPLLLLLVSCATTNLPPISPGGQPFQLEDDERRLWNRAREEERRVNRSGLLYDDPVLEAYLNNVAQRLLPLDVKAVGVSCWIKVIENPLHNAFALPHGAIYIHTGMLAQMENQAQLATVLSHEIAHNLHRNMVEEFRDVQNKTAFWATLQVVTAGFGVYGTLARLLGGLMTVAAVTGYSQSQEREADVEGLRLLVMAGYDPTEAPKVFERLMEDPDEGKVKEPFFFGTHPRLQERLENYTYLLRTEYATQAKEQGRLRNEEAFVSRIQRLLLDNAILDLGLGRFNTAKAAIQRVLARDPQNPRAHYLLGEIARQQGKPGDDEVAIQAYQQALLYDPGYPEPYKAVGLLYYKLGAREKARVALERYLLLAPHAADRGYIGGYLKELRRGESQQ